MCGRTTKPAMLLWPWVSSRLYAIHWPLTIFPLNAARAGGMVLPSSCPRDETLLPDLLPGRGDDSTGPVLRRIADEWARATAGIRCLVLVYTTIGSGGSSLTVGDLCAEDLVDGQSARGEPVTASIRKCHQKVK